MEAIKVILVTTAGKVGSPAARLIASASTAGIEHVVKVTNKADAHSPIARPRIRSEIEDALVASASLYPAAQQRLHTDFLMMAMIDVGLPEPLAKDNALAVAWMADGDCDYVTDDVRELLGRRAGSFQQFAIDHGQAFS